MKRLFFLVVFALIVLLTVQGATAALYSDYTAFPDVVLGGMDNTNKAFCAKVAIVGSSYTLNNISFYSGAPTGNPTFRGEVWSNNAAATPDEPDTLLHYFANSTAISSGWNSFVDAGADFTLSDGSTYWFCERGDSVDASNKAAVYGDYVVGIYNGTYSNSALPETWTFDTGFYASYKLYLTAYTPPTTVFTTYSLNITNLYNDSNLDGVNVTFGSGCWNTSVGGIATVSDNATECTGLTGTINVNASLAGYYFNASSYAIAANSTSAAGAYQTLYNITINELFTNTSVATPFNISVGSKNYSNGLNVYLINGTNTLTFSKNTINATYYNLNFTINLTSVPATGSAFYQGAYDWRVIVRVQDANKDLLPENGTINISEATLPYSYNAFIGNYSNTTMQYSLLRGYTYTFIANPLTYASANATKWVNASHGDNYLYRLNLTMYLARTFNLTFRDEITEALLNNTFELELISDLSAGRYNVSNGTLALELLTPAFYTLRWRSATHPERDYYETMYNESFFTINLYSLTTGNATDTLVRIVNTQGQSVENATVSLLRYYVSCNCYRVVEMAKTGFNGIAYMTAQEVEGHYKWIVEYQGVTRFMSTSPENLIADTGTGQITRTITIDLGTAYYESFIALTDLSSAVTYNELTSTLSFIWNDASDIVARGCLRAQFVNNSRWVTAGLACANGATGSVLLTVANANTTTYKWNAYVETNTAYSDYNLHSGWLNPAAIYGFGGVAAFGAVFVLVGGAAIFSFSAVAVLIWTAFSLLAVFLLQVATRSVLLPFDLQLITGFITLTVGLSIYLLRK